MPILFFIIAYLFLGIFTGEWTNLAEIGLNSKVPISNIFIIWLLWCFFYGVGEESGWGGFLMPEFSKKYKARISTLFTAFIWAPWHLPVFFYDKDFIAMGWFGAFGWVVGLIFGSFLLDWLAKQSNWNLWPVILWHGTFNLFTTSDRINPLFSGLMSMMVIVFVLWIARKYDDQFESITFHLMPPNNTYLLLVIETHRPPGYPGAYDKFLIIVGLGFNLLTVWYAWNWV